MPNNRENKLQHCCEDLIALFSQCFSETYRTRLIKGHDEPLYQPAQNASDYHRIIFAHGFFSSALHECAHWFIAGKERRKQEDYGYWYQPDGRSAEQQTLFESVEVKPQAVEWILAAACNYRFFVSADNLNASIASSHTFKAAIGRQVKHYLAHGLPDRAEIFRQALHAFYHTNSQLTQQDFDINRI